MLEAQILRLLEKDRNGHSVFAPSSSAMWLGCSGSLIPNLLAEDKGGYESAEGTVAHSVGERWLKEGRKPVELIGTNEFVEDGDWGHLIWIDEVMLDYVEQYVEWCQMLPGDHYVEQRVYFSQLTPIPNQGGTADHVACEPGRMVITDLKYGKGVPVRAEGNTQARLYALGFFYEWDWLYDFQEIEIRICQPRLDIFDSWTVTRDELLEFAEYVRERAHAAWSLTAPRKPSPEACRWCKVQASCPALAKLQHDLTAGAFGGIDQEITKDDVDEFKDGLVLMDELPVARISELSTSDMAILYRQRSLVEGWWKAVAEELERRATLGEAVPGHKLVEARTNRVFLSNAKAEARLKGLGLPEDKLWKRTFISPAQAEEELVKIGIPRKKVTEMIADIVLKPTGKPTLVPDSDKRPALVDVAGEAFASLVD